MKKTLALALTAAMAISAVSTTAFAASVNVKSDVEPWEKTATITLVDEDKGAATSDSVKNLPTLASDDVYKFVGWSKTKTDASEDAYATTADKKVLTKYGEIFAITGATVADADKGEKKAANKDVALYPVFRRWKNQKELDKWKEDQGKGADDEAKKKAFEDKLKAADESHNATNNWNTGKTIKTDKIEAGKGIVAAKQNAPVLAPSNGHDSQVVGIGDHDVAFYWDDTQTSAKKGADGSAAPDLISGKSTRLELELPEDYTTKDMDVTVYDIDGWCKATKVKKADMMTYGNKVYVWTSNPGHRFIVTLNPKGASTGSDKSNPATGDFSALPIAMLAVAALGATGFVAYKKRMAE